MTAETDDKHDPDTQPVKLLGNSKGDDSDVEEPPLPL